MKTAFDPDNNAVLWLYPHTELAFFSSVHQNRLLKQSTGTGAHCKLESKNQVIDVEWKDKYCLLFGF